MRYSIIVLFLLLFHFKAISQFENTGFGLAANYSYPHSTNDVYPHSLNPLPGWDDSQGAFAYQIDVHTFYKINPKLSIKTGVVFVKNKFLLDPDLNYSDQVTIKKGFDGNINKQNLPTKFKYFTSLNYISLPIGINCQLNSLWEVGAGIQHNFLLSAYEYLYLKYESGKVDSRFDRKRFRNEEYNKYVVSAYAEVNYNFKIYSFPLKAKMQVGYGISNYFSKLIPGTLRPITMNWGLAFRFKK